MAARHDWTRLAVREIYQRPLLDLVFAAQQIHRQFHDACQVQHCQLLSIKTGGCPEDCAYCPQSAHYSTGVESTPLMAVDETLQAARHAKEQGATRFCMGGAWRDAPDGVRFERILEMVRGIRTLGMEACCT